MSHLCSQQTVALRLTLTEIALTRWLDMQADAEPQIGNHAHAERLVLQAQAARMSGGDRQSALLPMADAPAAQALAFAVCKTCGTEKTEIRSKAITALQKFWPDARPIEVTHEAGGRA